MDTMEASNMAYVVLKEMTGGFREDLILGRGSFGVVYKGEDKNGQELAVKVFHPMEGLDDKVFRRELKNLAKLKHQNIVQLLGFCNDEEEVVVEHNGRHVHAFKMHRAICFEYVHNGSLRKHLSDVRQGFGWRTRYKIIKGICEGLKYLHTGLEVPVYHFDLKPDNILLDKNMVPKIADFGLSRIFGEEKTKQTISSLGTLGYRPPEFVKHQIISIKFDIFSLGVIIINIMIGPMGYSHTDEMEPAEFVEHVHNIWRETLQLMPGYTSIEIDCQQVKTCIEVALKCLEEDRRKRPSIEDIVRELSETEKNTNDPGSQVGQDIAGRIGVATGADESDRRAADSAFKDAISKHPGRPRFNVQWVDSVDEEYRPVEKQHWRKAKGSSGEQHGVLVKDSAEDMNKHADSGCLRDIIRSTESPVGRGVGNSSVEQFMVRSIVPFQPSGEAYEGSNASPAPLLVSGKDNPNHQQLAKESQRRQFSKRKVIKIDCKEKEMGGVGEKKLEHHHKFAKQIQEPQTYVNEVYERQKRYKLNEGTSSGMQMEIDPRLLALYVEVEKLVGIEGPSEEIISRFIGEKPTKQLKVVSIVGSGGSGKTTLAKQVYEKIKHQFKHKAFVSVSQNPNINNLMRFLLSEIGSSSGSSEPMGSYSGQHLINKLRAYLEKERYLIVIDDIWEKSAWETIQCALPKNGHASRIITTTRIKNVADSFCTSNEGFVYRMKPLSRSDATELFLKRTFDAKDKCPGHLGGIMNEILHKCDGLPLAIVTLASLLANKPRRKEEWKRVLNSIRSVDEKDKELEVMDKILALSYNDLPHNLKNCLLYLSAFPEDHEIDKDILVWRWIAEGFITAKQGYTLEEIGESHFNELINRSLIQPIDMAYDGKPRGCRVHDIVLNFIISWSTKENFVTVLDGQDLSPSNKRIRRLSVWDNKEHAEAISQGTMDLSQLRSLNICRVFGWTMPPVLDLPVLRVLDLEGCHELRNVHLDGIVGLFHLRYLGLRETRSIEKLPVQIGKLEYLQVLDLRGTSIRELPESIIQLKRLMRLVGDELRLPDGFGSMEALQELRTLDGCHCSMKDLQFLSKLRVLGVVFGHEGISDLQARKESLASSLCKLGASNLRSLHIDNTFGGADSFTDSWFPPPLHLQKFETKFWIPRFPKWINPALSDLIYLEINVEQMEGEDLRLLEDLPALLFLDLDVKQVPEDGLRISPGGFRCLTELKITNKDGPGLIFQGALPKLQSLWLWFNADQAQSTYGSLHIGIQHLTSLKCIWISVIFEDENNPTMMAAIGDQVQMLPNHPLITIESYGFRSGRTELFRVVV